MAPCPKIEFRIPISPTEKFYSLVRFFNFGLRRLEGAAYQDARLLVVVGDYCDLDAVRRANQWSENFNIAWEATPTSVFDEFHWGGTANWRLHVPAGDSDVIFLCDADTVLVRNIDPLLRDFPTDERAVGGHMAHLPPPLADGSTAPSTDGPEFWPWLFRAFDIPWPAITHRYSMDKDFSLPVAPAYFNLGFIALSPGALAEFGSEVDEVTRRILQATGSHMRCQIALTVMAYRARMRIDVLPAAYNAANDLTHMAVNELKAEQIRVLHFLREDEVNRGELQPSLIDGLLTRSLNNPANVLLQNLAREYRASIT